MYHLQVATLKWMVYGLFIVNALYMRLALNYGLVVA